MTWVLGVFGGETSFIKNKYLKDGNACLIKDGRLICGIAEERLSRFKHDGNYYLSIKYCLETAGITIDDVDLVVFGNCCDYPLHPKSTNGFNLNKKKVFNIPSHHLSHAYVAYKMSNYKTGFIIVMDNEGNILGRKKDFIHYWNNKLERNSYYLINQNLSLLNRDSKRANEIGVGDTYHYFTHFLGWSSYTKAGRLMGLSSYGDRKRFENINLFNIDKNGYIKSNLSNNRLKKEEEIINFGKKFNMNLPPPRRKGQRIIEGHKNIAAFVQKSTEEIIKRKVEYLTKNIEKNNICLSGGVGYNCHVNRVINDIPTISNVFIPYCPGDEGQSLGNALWGYYEVLKGKKAPQINNPFMGKKYNNNDIERILYEYKKRISWEKRSDFIEITAESIAKGEIIGWFQDGSEFGNRALGNRSILANPSSKMIKKKLNKIKGREDFRPFSPSILFDQVKIYYDSIINSPFMNNIGYASEKTKKELPGIVHVDNTSRIQTVKKGFNNKYFKLINCVFQKTQIPMILNTSFNYNNEPIVETPLDAMNDFLIMGIDKLILGEYVIRKR